MISLPSNSRCAAVLEPPTTSAGPLSAVPDASCVFDSTRVPVIVPPDLSSLLSLSAFPCAALNGDSVEVLIKSLTTEDLSNLAS